MLEERTINADFTMLLVSKYSRETEIGGKKEINTNLTLHFDVAGVFINTSTHLLYV